MEVIIKSFANESILCSRQYLSFQVIMHLKEPKSTAVLRRQDGFKWILKFCVLWSRKYHSGIVFSGLIIPTWTRENSFLTIDHLWSDFLMMCGIKWFCYHINSKPYPNYQRSKSLYLFQSWIRRHIAEFCRQKEGQGNPVILVLFPQRNWFMQRIVSV